MHCSAPWGFVLHGVSPQLLVTAVLADVPGWSGEVESAILKRGDSKAAAALLRSPREQFVSTDRPGRSGSRQSRSTRLGLASGHHRGLSTKLVFPGCGDRWNSSLTPGDTCGLGGAQYAGAGQLDATVWHISGSSWGLARSSCQN